MPARMLGSSHLSLSNFLQISLILFFRMLRDDRIRPDEEMNIFNVKDAPDRLG